VVTFTLLLLLQPGGTEINIVSKFEDVGKWKMNVAARENVKQNKYRDLSGLFLVKKEGAHLSAHGDVRAISGDTAKVSGVSKYCVCPANWKGKHSCEALEQVVSWRWLV
jgi:hypothetical protein